MDVGSAASSCDDPRCGDQCGLAVRTDGSGLGSAPFPVVPLACFDDGVSLPLRWSQRSLGGCCHHKGEWTAYAPTSASVVRPGTWAMTGCQLWMVCMVPRPEEPTASSLAMRVDGRCAARLSSVARHSTSRNAVVSRTTASTGVWPSLHSALRGQRSVMAAPAGYSMINSTRLLACEYNTILMTIAKKPRAPVRSRGTHSPRHRSPRHRSPRHHAAAPPRPPPHSRVAPP